MGDRYAEIVVTCLTCLDKSNTDFGDDSEFEDAEDVLIGLDISRRYVTIS
jgi:hypothetical protein